MIEWHSCIVFQSTLNVAAAAAAAAAKASRHGTVRAAGAQALHGVLLESFDTRGTMQLCMLSSDTGGCMQQNCW
jgi:pyridoxine/pyridoxamine 5'-phosphate oxidase